MIKGVIFFEQGGIQAIGELNSLAGIIDTMKKVLPDFEKQEKQRVFNSMTKEEIAELLKERDKAEAEL